MTGDQRPAFLYQLVHQGTEADPGRLHRFRHALAARHHRHPAGLQRLRPDRALAFGKDRRAASGRRRRRRPDPTRPFLGNRPTSTIMVDRLDPKSLGSLVALYEHSRLHPGCDLGPSTPSTSGGRTGQAWRAIIPELRSKLPPLDHDSSTAGLIRRYRGASGRRYEIEGQKWPYGAPFSLLVSGDGRR